jgi:putative membrane protein
MFYLNALMGALVASVLACAPALHIYNVAGLLILLGAGTADVLGPEELSALMIGLLTGYAMLNTLPSIFFSAPDESTIFIVPPGQKYLLQGRGYEAAVLTGVGGLGGVAVLTLLTPVAAPLGSAVRAIVQPHLHWVLAAVTVFMLMSEWPKGTGRAPSPWRRLAEAWTSLGAGLVTFFLSGLLGFVLMYRCLVPAQRAYQSLLPAFVGLFAVPWLLLNMVSRVRIPRQFIATSVGAGWPTLLRGVLAGTAGGLFAAFFPVVTGGVGALMAGHATAQRDDRLFLISQGASKVVYYVGAYLLFFVPSLHLRRGGMAWMLSSVYTPYTPTVFYRAVAAVLLCAVVSFFVLLPLTRVIAGLVARVDYVRLSAVTLLVLVVMVTGVTGPGGLLIAAVATGIGLIPVLWGSRRMHCMGVLLLPLTLNMAGLGGTVAGWLGLV